MSIIWQAPAQETYYFRLAAHNQSGSTSMVRSIGSAMRPAGANGRTLVHPTPCRPEACRAGCRSIRVIPGIPLNLDVTGGDGKFVATWDDPATGNLTIDDVAISGATERGVHARGRESPAAGWGHASTC